MAIGEAVGCADDCMFDGKCEVRDDGGLCTKGRIGEEGDEGDSGADNWLAFDWGDDGKAVIDWADEVRTVPSEVVLCSGWLDDAAPTSEMKKKKTIVTSSE